MVSNSELARQSNLLQLRHDCDANDRGISSRDKAKGFCQKNVNWRAFWWKLQQFSLLLRSAHQTAKQANGGDI